MILQGSVIWQSVLTWAITFFSNHNFKEYNPRKKVDLFVLFLMGISRVRFFGVLQKHLSKITEAISSVYDKISRLHFFKLYIVQ